MFAHLNDSLKRSRLIAQPFEQARRTCLLFFLNWRLQLTLLFLYFSGCGIAGLEGMLQAKARVVLLDAEHELIDQRDQ